MKLNKINLLQVACSIIFIATTYATSEAEVNLQQAAPPRPLKFGDKTTVKIPQKEVLFSTTPSSANKNNVNASADRERPKTRNRPQSRIERISSAPAKQSPQSQMSRRYDSGGGSAKNQVIVQQHDIPIVHKSRDLLNKPINPVVGQKPAQQKLEIQQYSQQQQNEQQRQQHQQQRQQQNVNRSRFSNSIVQTQQQEPMQHSSIVEQSAAIAKTTTRTTTRHNKSRQKPAAATTTRTIPSTVNNQHRGIQSPSSSHNLHNSNYNRINNSSIVSHQQQRSSFGISYNSQPLLAVTAAATAAGSQSKAITSSNKQRSSSNIPVNQRVSSANRSNIRKSPTTTASTTTTSSSTTSTSRPPFQLPNFNIFSPEFWQFLNPTISPISHQPTLPTTRKPPKKYKPASPISTKEEKLNYPKPKTTTVPTKQPDPVLNSIPKRDDGPFRIALPTFNILSPRRDTLTETEKDKRDVDEENLRSRFNCPRESEVRFQLFPKICKIDEDCKVWKRDEICCEIFGAKSCVSGIPKPLEETSHSPILGVIPRKCPDRPLAELWWEVKECETDMDCWPRVCCPDGRRRYCRTSQPELNTVPVPVKRSFNYLSEYLECTAPPPPIFDLHPKTCTSTFDCFPNVCCQEAGLRHCRPPKKSVLTMLANVFNVDFVKRLTQNIVIK